MALKLPIELFEDIVLLNDDAIDDDNGDCGSTIPRGDANCVKSAHFTFYPKRAKDCAKNMGAVCSLWRSYLLHSSRLWLCRLELPFDGRYSLTQLQVADAFSTIVQTSCDMDIGVSYSGPNSTDGNDTDKASEITMKILEILKPTSSYWRSLSVSTDRKLQFRPTWISRLPRLIKLHFYCRDVVFHDDPNLLFPHLRFTIIDNIGECKPKHFAQLANTETLHLVYDQQTWSPAFFQTSFPYLRSLYIRVRGFPTIPDGGIKSTLHIPNLRTLWLNGTWSIVFATIGALIPSSKLSQLRLSVRGSRGEKVTPPSKPFLIPSLTELSFEGNDFRPLISSLDKATFDILQILNIGTIMSWPLLELNFPLPKLKRIDLFGAFMPLSHLDAPKLEEYYIECRRGDSFDFSSVPASSTSFPLLRTVQLRGGLGITTALDNIHCPSLHTLDLRIDIRPQKPQRPFYSRETIDETHWRGVVTKWENALPPIKKLCFQVPPKAPGLFETLKEKMQGLDTLRLIVGADSDYASVFEHLFIPEKTKDSENPGRLKELELFIEGGGWTVTGKAGSCEGPRAVIDALDSALRRASEMEEEQITSTMRTLRSIIMINFAFPKVEKHSVEERMELHGLLVRWIDPEHGQRLIA